MAWLRLYDTLPDDPKVQLLPPELFRTWINLLCVAKRNNGRLGPVTDLAFTLRLSPQQITDQLDGLIKAQLIDKLPSGCFTPHNWKKFQFASDDAAARMRRYRKRNSDVTRDGPEQSRTEQNREESKEAKEASLESTQAQTSESAPLKNGSDQRRRGTRLPAESPSFADRNWAMAECHWSETEVDAVAAQYRDHWVQQPGQKGVKLDWSATWRNWCRNEVKFSKGGKNGRTPARNGWVEALLAEGAGEPTGDADDLE